MKVEWLTRAQCGLPPAPHMTPRPVHLIGTTPHYTATADHDAHPLETWARIAHEATSGGLADHYVDTPYNAGVCKLADGVGGILAGRPNNVIGAHARPIPMHGHPEPPSWADVANLYTLGVALIGTTPTPEALAALKAYLYVANVGEHAPQIFPHSFWDPTACPGDPVRAWLAGLHSKFVHLVDR